MDYEKLKPDFTKIAIAFSMELEYVSYRKEWESLKKEFKSNLSEDIPFDNINFKDLMTLLKEFQLEEFKDDFLYFAYVFSSNHDKYIEMSDLLMDRIEASQELLKALNLFYNNELKDLKISLKHKKYNITVNCSNQLLLEDIKNSLLKSFVNSLSFEEDNIKKEDITDWGKFIQSRLQREESFPKKKGRKSKSLELGSYISKLQYYLQDFTHIKVDEGIKISSEQAIFIYNFLRCIGFFLGDIGWEKDNVTKTLEKYNKKLIESKYGDDDWVIILWENIPISLKNNKKK